MKCGYPHIDCSLSSECNETAVRYFQRYESSLKQFIFAKRCEAHSLYFIENKVWNEIPMEEYIVSKIMKS